MLVSMSFTIDTESEKQLDEIIQMFQRLKFGVQPIAILEEEKETETWFTLDEQPIEMLKEYNPNTEPSESSEETEPTSPNTEKDNSELRTRKPFTKEEKYLIWDLVVNQHKSPRVIGEQFKRKPTSISQLVYLLRKDPPTKPEPSVHSLPEPKLEHKPKPEIKPTPPIQYHCEKCGEMVHDPIWIHGKAYHENCSRGVH